MFAGHTSCERLERKSGSCSLDLKADTVGLSRKMIKLVGDRVPGKLPNWEEDVHNSKTKAAQTKRTVTSFKCNKKRNKISIFYNGHYVFLQVGVLLEIMFMMIMMMMTETRKF